jgi:predicted DNA-binding protein (UPF0251 family)
VDKFLEQLAKRLQIYDADIVTADETKDWPDGKLGELAKTGILTEIEHAKGVICDQCEEKCYIEPDIRTIPDTRKTIGVFVCTRNRGIGRIEVDPNRPRQWRINRDKLETLGLLKKNVKRRRRRVSSELSERETEVFTLIHVQKKTQQQAAIEMCCSPQYIAKVLKKSRCKGQSSAISLGKFS